MSEEYKVTNVRLPAEMLLELKLRAAREGKSVAQLVRESITYYLTVVDEELTDDEWRDDPLFKLGTEIVGSGPGDGSENHDAYLYEMNPSSSEEE